MATLSHCGAHGVKDFRPSGIQRLDERCRGGAFVSAAAELPGDAAAIHVVAAAETDLGGSRGTVSLNDDEVGTKGTFYVWHNSELSGS
jgi:hypothetical protein